MRSRLLALCIGIGVHLFGCRVAPATGAVTPSAAPAAPAISGKHFKMRTYMFVLLRRGPAWTPEQTPETEKLFEGHMANIKAMARAKKLLIAGPFDDAPGRPDAIAGLFIFDTIDEAEVRALMAHDPAIASGRLVPELHRWYGPAGLTYDGAAEALAAP
jgi:uncharacterized protein YciI